MADSLLEIEVRQQLRSERFKMPNLPHVATQALAMAQDEKSTCATLAKLICQDQGLATNLLRIANSPAYAGTREIVSLQQATTRLGMQTIAELAITICVRGSLFPKKTYADLSKTLWAQALATALFAKEIARQQRRNVEAAYLGGLLHRIGMPLVLKAITEVRDKNQRPSAEIAEALLLSLHVEIGLRACKSWKLPEQVSAAVEFSEDFEKTEQHRHLAAVVNLAQQLASALNSDTGFEPVFDLPVLDELSMYPPDLSKVVEHQDRIRGVIGA